MLKGISSGISDYYAHNAVKGSGTIEYYSYVGISEILKFKGNAGKDMDY